METRKETYKDGIQITDMKKGDTIYICKTQSGFSITYECSFVSYEKGIVTATIISCDHDWNIKTGNITARPSSCYLWGKGKNDNWAICHWFD